MLLSAGPISSLPISDVPPIVARAACSILATTTTTGTSTRIDAKAVATIESETGDVIGPLWVPIPESMTDPWTLIPE